MKNIKLYESKHDPRLDDIFHQLNLGNVGNVIYWYEFFKMVSTIKGDIVECGVGRGRSLVIIAALNFFLSSEEGGQRTIFGYDSFEGFPDISPEDASSRNPQKGDWSFSPSGKYKYSPEFIYELLESAGISAENQPRLVKGFFCDTLQNHPDREIAVLHIDGDLYSSYKDTLHNLYDKVSSGGLVIFDDFYAGREEDEKFPGARKAVQEFFGEQYSRLQVSIGGTYYHIKE